MNTVYINGIGIISRAGNTVDEIWNNLNSCMTTDAISSKLQYTSVIEKSKLRRITRYAKLAAEVSTLCLSDAGISDAENQNNEKMGIIFTTGYGASESNVKFFDSVAKKEPDLCSPLTFASLVPNYSLGNVCILLGIKGYSTTLLGGNPIDLAIPVLCNGKAENMIVGAQEEYCEEVFKAVDMLRMYHKSQLAECSAAMYLSCHLTEYSYASVLTSGSVALESSPFLSNGVSISEDVFSEILSDIVKMESPDVIFGIGTQLEFGNQEKLAFEKILPDIPYISSVRTVFGETLGSSFLLNAAFASVCLKKQENPFENNKQIKSILATGIDVQGNYMYVLLKSIERS